MWSKPVTVEAPAVEPILLNQAKQFLRLDEDEDGFDVELDVHIAGARGKIEALTSSRMIQQTVEIQADSFADLALLPIGPVTSILDVSYLDRDGVVQSIDADSLDLVGTGLEMGIQLRTGRWPSLPLRSRVNVRLVVGYGPDGSTMPEGVRIGMLLQIRALFDGGDVDLDHWLVDDRIWLI
jgi:uncharacterized phiE125 gp8 family phage protein